MTYANVKASISVKEAICTSANPMSPAQKMDNFDSKNHVYTNSVVKFWEFYEYTDEETAKLGNGAFGIVYKGRNRKTGRTVAIKRLPGSGEYKKNELSVIQSLDCPQLVTLLDICPVSHLDCTFLVMELCDGDLDHHLSTWATEGRLKIENLKVVIDNIARGYDFLYNERIVHRDIKPQNLLVQYKHKSSNTMFALKITDFGISRMIDNQSMELLSNVAGSILYMAPEVGANLVKTHEYDFQVDMWSIGCVLFQCVSGELPFDESSLCRQFLHAAGGNYEAYEKPLLPDGTPPGVDALVRALLEMDARKRPNPDEFYDMAIDLTGHNFSTLVDGI